MRFFQDENQEHLHILRYHSTVWTMLCFCAWLTCDTSVCNSEILFVCLLVRLFLEAPSLEFEVSLISGVLAGTQHHRLEKSARAGFLTACEHSLLSPPWVLCSSQGLRTCLLKTAKVGCYSIGSRCTMSDHQTLGCITLKEGA